MTPEQTIRMQYLGVLQLLGDVAAYVPSNDDLHDSITQAMNDAEAAIPGLRCSQSLLRWDLYMQAEEESLRDVIHAARERLIANTTPCPKCGADWGLIARCASPDCPSLEVRFKALRNALNSR